MWFCCAVQRSYDFLTIGLSLPDSISHAPQSRKYKEEIKLILTRLPEQESEDTAEIGQCS